MKIFYPTPNLRRVKLRGGRYNSVGGTTRKLEMYLLPPLFPRPRPDDAPPLFVFERVDGPVSADARPGGERRLSFAS